MQQLRSDKKSLETENRYLKEIIAQLKHQKYGRSCEKFDAQGDLFNEAEEAELEEVPVDDEPELIEVVVQKKSNKAAKPRVSIPDHLPRIDRIHDLLDDEKFCPHDGTELTCFGESSHEQLEVIPEKLQVVNHIQKKYACPCCEKHIIQAQKPKAPIPKSIAGPSLLAYLLVKKYQDAMPLYRQAQSMQRMGFELNTRNLANWMIQCGQLIQPLINLMQDHCLSRPLLHMDETRVQVLREPGKAAESQSYMWLLSAFDDRPVILFRYDPSRSQTVATNWLEGTQKNTALMVDGYAGYNQVCDRNQLNRLGCWAHARRKFTDIVKARSKKEATQKTGKADWVLNEIKKLYRIEQDYKEQPSDQRYQARQQKAVPILNKIKTWLEKSVNQAPPKTALGKALSYLDNQWPLLIRYTENGLWPIDNNIAERAIRPFTIGRKNWMFSTSQAGAKASASIYSLLETAKANELNTFDYMLKVLTDLPNAESVEEMEALLPWNIQLEK